MSTQSSSRPCRCGVPQHCASDPRCPVVFDKDANEYRLVAKDGTVLSCMHFCFHCGGSLPVATRTKYWGEPDPQEVEVLMARLEPARSWQEVLAILGPADSEFAGTLEFEGKRSQVRRVVFGSVAKSFELRVFAYEDGEWSYSLAGKLSKKQTATDYHKHMN